nr:hypothetical protein 9 [bacterium]
MSNLDTSMLMNEKTAMFQKSFKELVEQVGELKKQNSDQSARIALLEEQVRLLKAAPGRASDSDLQEVQELRDKMRERGIPFDLRMKANALRELLKKAGG